MLSGSKSVQLVTQIFSSPVFCLYLLRICVSSVVPLIPGELQIRTPLSITKWATDWGNSFMIFFTDIFLSFERGDSSIRPPLEACVLFPDTSFFFFKFKLKSQRISRRNRPYYSGTVRLLYGTSSLFTLNAEPSQLQRLVIAIGFATWLKLN